MNDPVHGFLTGVSRLWDWVLLDHPPTVRRVEIAETAIELAIAGTELANTLLPAFECHPDTTRPADSTVGAWDAAATGVRLPARLRDVDPLVRQWIVRRDGCPMAEVEWPSDDLVRVGNRYSGRHLLGVSSAGVLSPWEAGAPLRRQLWWALGPGALFAHAGAVGDADGVALLMGASGAGKSTTSLACARAGMGLLADDYCIVRGDPPVAHLLHATARVHREELPYVGGMDDVSSRFAPVGDDPDMKALLFPYRAMPSCFLRSAPVRVVLVLERGALRTPALVPMRGADALRAVAPSALWQMHLDAGRELEALRKLVSSVPAYRLILGEDRAANPDCIREALQLAAS